MGEKTILIAEDEALIGILLKTCLSRMGYVICDIVSTGRAVIEKAILLKPNLILMDVFLEDDINGLQAIEAIYQHGRIPVIIMTGTVDPMILEKIEETGLPTLYKPYSIDGLMNLVSETLLNPD